MYALQVNFYALLVNISLLLRRGRLRRLRKHLSNVKIEEPSFHACRHNLDVAHIPMLLALQLCTFAPKSINQFN
jgi:hypothetical protein